MNDLILCNRGTFFAGVAVAGFAAPAAVVPVVVAANAAGAGADPDTTGVATPAAACAPPGVATAGGPVGTDCWKISPTLDFSLR